MFKSRQPVIPQFREHELQGTFYYVLTSDVRDVTCTVGSFMQCTSSSSGGDFWQHLGFADEEAEPRETDVSKFTKHRPPSPSPFPLQPS